MSDLLDMTRTIARVNAWKAYEKARREHEATRKVFEALVVECPGFCPEDYKGHWRDWHKGHGCAPDIRGNLLAYEREIAAAAEAKPAPQKVEPEVMDGFGAPILAGETYLISDDRSRDYVTWWRPESKGYTVRRDQAGRYTGEEAAEICRIGKRYRTTPPTFHDVPMAWPESRIAKGIIWSVVTVESLLSLPAEPEVPRG